MKNYTEEEIKALEPTIGAQRVRLKFNPSGLATIQNTKAAYAERINALQELRGDKPDYAQRDISRAQTMAEDACMLEVKAYTA